MTSPSTQHNAIFSVIFTFLYVALYYLSDWMVGNQALGGIASLIFLPAFIRLLGFLVIDYWIIPALFVAGLFCVDLGLGLSGKVVVSAFLSVGGPFVCASRLMCAAEQLRKLRRYHHLAEQFTAMSSKCRALVDADSVEFDLAG